MMRTFHGLLIILLLAPMASSGSPDVHNGWFREVCTYASFHFSDVKELAVGEELVLQTGGASRLGAILDVSPGVWLNVSGERCTGDAKCEPVRNAQMWFESAHGKLKRVKGKFSFDLGPRHIEGNFVARSREAKIRPQCE